MCSGSAWQISESDDFDEFSFLATPRMMRLLRTITMLPGNKLEAIETLIER